MGSKGSKWSSLKAPGTENPLSHPVLELGKLPFLTMSPLGSPCEMFTNSWGECFCEERSDRQMFTIALKWMTFMRQAQKPSRGWSRWSCGPTSDGKTVALIAEPLLIMLTENLLNEVLISNWRWKNKMSLKLPRLDLIFWFLQFKASLYYNSTSTAYFSLNELVYFLISILCMS